MTKPKRTIAALLLLAAAACTGAARTPVPEAPLAAEAPPPVPPVPAARRPPDPAMLVGTRWILVEAGGEPVRQSSEPTLEFWDGSLGGHSGCNAYGTTY